MFRQLTKQVRASREKIISLLLVPSILLGTMSHTVCICADGHREEFCQAVLRGPPGKASSNAVHGGCSCCKDPDSHSVPSCCKGKASHASGGSTAPAEGASAKNGSCCHPSVEAPAPASGSGKADVGWQLTQVATIDLPPVLLSADEFQPTLDRSSFATPPPIDAVIVFLHLTI